MSQELTYSRWGARIIAHGLWTADDTRFASEHGVRHVVLREAKGWEPSPLGFLLEIPSLRCVEILSSRLEDLAPLENLSNLWGLGLGAVAATRMSFERLKDLREIGVSWQPGFVGFGACHKLRSAVIGGYPKRDLSELAEARDLFKLRLVGGALVKFERHLFPNLAALDLSLIKSLSNIEGLTSLTSLRAINLKGRCKVDSYDVLGEISTLEFLTFENLNLPDIQFVAKLERLKKLVLLYSNVLDGKLSVLDRLTDLECVVFQERRHYDRTRSQLPSDCRSESIWSDPHLINETMGKPSLVPLDIQSSEWFDRVDVG
jgi:hypothetical protein